MRVVRFAILVVVNRFAELQRLSSNPRRECPRVRGSQSAASLPVSLVDALLTTDDASPAG